MYAYQGEKPKMIEIKEIATKKDLKLFATYPLKLYKDCPYYIPSLRSDELNTFNPKKNFSLKNNKAKGFLCYKDGELVGRIAGLINYKDNELSGKKYVRFSRFECIDDLEVFKALLGAVEKFGLENGMEIIHGPWGFNDTDREGMLTYGFDVRSTYATNYYYPYFSENMVKLGFNDESKWLERKFVITPEVPERVRLFAGKIKEKYKLTDVTETMSIRKIIKKYGDSMFETLNQAYASLDGYVPIEEKAKKNVLSQFATIANVKFVSFLVDEKGECVAFGLCLPSICDALKKHDGKLFPTGFIGVLKSIKKPKQLEMALIGVRPEYKNSGMNAVIIDKVLRNIIAEKIELLESNPMLETNNNINNQWNRLFDTEITKRRQTYKKEIGSLI